VGGVGGEQEGQRMGNWLTDGQNIENHIPQRAEQPCADDKYDGQRPV